ncbi:MAG: ATP-binding protein [Cucumibacter sp.]
MKKTGSSDPIDSALESIAQSLEILSGRHRAAVLELGKADAYLWDAAGGRLQEVVRVNRIDLGLLKGIDEVADQLVRNTLQFALGHGANNALLWGARGTGKSSLIKAVHAHVSGRRERGKKRLVLVEVNREEIETLPRLLKGVAALEARVLIFCDDLTFDQGEATYRSLKTILDGGLEGRPGNALLYATSNRRHLMPREMIENERSTAINPSEAAEDKISLSDRFGLWLGFHPCDQPTYLEMVASYARHFGIDMPAAELRAGAIEWAATGGARWGRVAIQFIRQIAGERGQSVELD